MAFGAKPGQFPCKWHKGCGNPEIEGMEYCVYHVPDDMLEEAEEVTGLRRCRHKFGEPDACRRQAIQGGNICNVHGGNAGGPARTAAVAKVIDNGVVDRLGEIMSANGDKLLKPAPIEDPFAELLSTVAEVKALKDIMRDQVHELIAKRQMRYQHKQAGEQLRVEILVYERAIERLITGLVAVSKLKIEDRMAGIREAQLRMLEHALDQALEDSGVGLDGKLNARRTFRANVRVIQGELSA